MSYEEKKALFGGKVPDLQGAEYYVGGIFELNNKNYQAPTSSDFVDNFDWRNRHGKNWLTSVKDQQSCGSCAIFSSVGAVEAMTNLYFNKKIDIDLSEQQIVSCLNGDCQSGWMPADALLFCKTSGVVEESCFPYQMNSSIPCASKSSLLCWQSGDRCSLKQSR